MEFNNNPARVMHIDINSCFATIEQQANPLLRDQPIAVAAYDSPNGCILAASIEAKRYGIKTGMRVKDGKKLYPYLKVMAPDANKYRFIHHKMHALLTRYSSDVHPKSIDEFVLNFKNHTIAKKQSMEGIGKEIKQKIREEVGDYISVSVGIGPNRLLAKVAAGMKKPDGLVEINSDNFLERYKTLSLVDLHGINTRYERRLASAGIYTTLQFYESPLWRLRVAFKSVNALYWYMRLRGYEPDDIEFSRKTYGNSYSFPRKLVTPKEISPTLAKLVNKTARRLRNAGYKARGVHLGIFYKDKTYWHKGETVGRSLFATRDIFELAYKLLCESPSNAPVHTLSVTCFSINDDAKLQLELFGDVEKKVNLASAMDKINETFGDYMVITANALNAKNAVPDRIAFARLP